ncbi:hypothetical protein DV451_001578 [Geotrichum candidum]|nr:hypothetical protein DV451_001578 [Geotrichum candidum]KAI9214209.1 hypothetical protein DS838_000851 [Geotrichum bryndzae]KAF5114484.1 hypothetical protein DV452_003292 [Geotrichum candidum]KAF5115330.1 hypothetical protein DV454_002366 [Geotrichum candidum]KAF5136090.1 hypothetical protein DV495_000161 [Geotrichum candidum]
MQNIGRRAHIVNLDPAAEPSAYEFTVDIRDLISLQDVMEELELGPNGGLVYCFEFLMNNLDWLSEQIGDYDDEFLIFDCPGQIELYTHIPILPSIVKFLTRQMNFSLCATYLLEAPFVIDRPKFFSGVLSAMSAMILLETPHINILSKMDLVEAAPVPTSGDAAAAEAAAEASGSSVGPGALNEGTVSRRELKRFLNPDPLLLADEANAKMNPKFHSLNSSIANLIDDFGMVQFLPLKAKDPDSVATILSYIDDVTQWAEAQEPKEPKDEFELENDFDDMPDNNFE